MPRHATSVRWRALLGPPAICAWRELSALLLEHGLERLQLALGGRAAQAEHERVLEPIAVGRGVGPLGQDPGGQPLGDLDQGRVVEQRQRLERRVGSQPPRAGLHAAGRVEGRQERMRRRPPEDRCRGRGDSGSGPTSATQGRFIWPSVITPSGWGGKTLGPPILRRQQTAAREGRVADQLGVQPQPRLPPEQPVVGIDRLPLGSDAATPGDTSPSSRSAGGSLSGSSRESISSQASQSSSSGWLGDEPWVPKSLSVSTRPRPKYDLPDPVDHHPGRQRVPAIDQPAGQVQPIGRRARALHSSSAGRTRGTPGIDAISLAREVAAQMDVRRHAGCPAARCTTIVVTNFGSAARSFSRRVNLGPECRLVRHHQLDQRPALRGRPLFARQVERHADVGILRLGEFEVQRLFPALLALIEVGILLGQVPGGARRSRRGPPVAGPSSAGVAISRSGSSTLLKKAKSW